MLQDGWCAFRRRIRGVNALFFALLFSLTGPAVSTPVQNPGDFALVPVRDGYVMAWSDGPRIYAERLDANLQASSTPFSFPLVVPASVSSIALASTGTSVLVTWHELRNGGVEAQYASILDVDVRSMRYGPLFMTIGTEATAAGTKDGKYRLVTTAQVWTVDDRLGIESAEGLPDAIAAALSANGDAGSAKRKTSVSCMAGGFNPVFFWQICNYDEAVTFTAPAGRAGFDFQWHTSMTGGKPDPGNGSDPLLRPPFIAPNGDGFVGAVVTAGGSSVCEVRDGGRTWTVAKPLLAVAGNGSEVLAVWRDTALRAMFLDGETFTLSDDGGSPKIVPAGSNAFVVLYSRGSSIVAQRVTVQPPRNRAVR